MENPFVFGKVVSGENFADRIKEREEIKKSVKAGQNVIIHGPRRYGKTSLIEMVAEELRKERIPVAMVNAEYLITKKALAEAIAGAAHAAFNPTTKKFYEALDVLKEIFPSIRIKPSEDLPMCIEFDEPRKNEDKLLENSLVLGETYAKKKDTMAVMAIDEFPYVEKNVGGNVMHLMRAVMQRQQHVAYVMLGSSRTMMERIFDSKESPFYKFGKKMEIKEMDDAEFKRFIGHKFSRGGMEIGMDQIEETISIAEKNPYYVQQVCHEIWNQTVEKKKVSGEDIKNAQGRIIENEKSTYIAIIDNLTSVQLKVLKNLSMSPEHSYSEENLSILGLSAGGFQKAVKALAAKDLIIRDNGGWKLEDPFFSMFLRRFR